MTTPAGDETAFRRGFAHALREVQRGLALAADRGLTLAEFATALSAYQDAVATWRALPTDRFIAQPPFRPGEPPAAQPPSEKTPT